MTTPTSGAFVMNATPTGRANNSAIASEFASHSTDGRRNDDPGGYAKSISQPKGETVGFLAFRAGRPRSKTDLIPKGNT